MWASRKKVLIFGKFDALHPGHIYLINQAQKLGRVTAVLETDEAIRSLRGEAPCYQQAVRQKILLKYGIKIYLRYQQDYHAVLKDLSPDILLFGYDQDWLNGQFRRVINAGDYGVQTRTARAWHPEFCKSSKIKSVLSDPQAAFYFLDKAKGTPSFQTVSLLRRCLHIKKIGFSGTLDPLASGLMILASGRATKILDWFHFLPKTYEADILFGQHSDTYDLAGRISINERARAFGQKDLSTNLKKFLGPQEQIAPTYSAKKVAGHKLHELARQGRDLTAPRSHIEIYELEVKKFRYPQLRLFIKCSAGTYIRSLAQDLGQAMSTGALLADLRRLSIGGFSLKIALAIEKIDERRLRHHCHAPAQIIDSLNQWFYRSLRS